MNPKKQMLRFISFQLYHILLSIFYGIGLEKNNYLLLIKKNS